MVEYSYVRQRCLAGPDRPTNRAPIPSHYISGILCSQEASLQTTKGAGEIRNVHRAKSHRGVIAVAAVVEPVVALRYRVKRRVRAHVRLA